MFRELSLRKNLSAIHRQIVIRRVRYTRKYYHTARTMYFLFPTSHALRFR